MKQTPAFSIASRCGRILCAMLAILILPATMERAEAQMVAVIVNGSPITNYDIEQRSKLIQLSTHKVPPRKDVIEELINEHLKLQLLKRYNIEGVDKDVDSAYANMARRMRASPKQFAEQLERSGVYSETIRSRIKAEMVWSQVIRGRFQSSFQFSDKDIQTRLETQKPGEATIVGFDFTLRPILFVVPRGSPLATFEARRKDAEAFRGRFKSCDQSIPYARALPFVAVRASVVKSSAELPPALREMLEKTELGGITAPEITQQGIEVYVLCGKKPSSAENTPAKRAIRDEMFKEQFEGHSVRFLKELRSQAMIEYR